MNDDNKRMVLLGHLGRTRNPIPDIRRIAIQSMAKTAGEGVQRVKSCTHERLPIRFDVRLFCFQLTLKKAAIL